GEWLQFQVELLPPFDQTAEAVAGWPVLIENGVVQPLNGSDTLVAGRHPRTALGFNDEYLFLVAADGRQPGYADGMTLAELAEFMAALAPRRPSIWTAAAPPRWCCGRRARNGPSW